MERIESVPLGQGTMEGMEFMEKTMLVFRT